MDKKVLNWLLKGDPSIRYQVLRDIVRDEAINLVQEHEKIAGSGWCKKLLDYQDSSGLWGNSWYSPKWTSTFYTLLTLKQLDALPVPEIITACNLLLDKGFTKNGGITFWKTYKTGEPCVTGMLLSVLCHFGIMDERIVKMFEFLAGEQMKDGGWNCERINGATHSSFHTTLSVLEGLWEFEKKYPGKSSEIPEMREKAMEFLLEHRLYKSHRTGQIINSRFTRFTFPPGWRYDIMRCLDFLRLTTDWKDERIEDAINLIRKKQTKEGYWNAEALHPGKYFFSMEQAGKPGRWNTLRAIRILNWWESW